MPIDKCLLILLLHDTYLYSKYKTLQFYFSVMSGGGILTDFERCAVCAGSRHRGQKLRAIARWRELERRRRRRARQNEEGKRRRSINIGDARREQFVQLYSRKHNSVIEITPDGKVQTTTNKSSVYCTFS